ncbi:MAG TPA: ATP-grasp domain-containing protein [Kofleriaceae bacterium]
MKPMVVVLEPVSSGVSLLEAARRLGYATIAVSHDADDRTLSADARSAADEVVRCDTNDLSALTETVQRLAQRHTVKAVLPGFEYYVTAATRINAQLKLPGLPLDSADCVRNKHAMRTRLASRGVRVPRFAFVRTQAELLEAARIIGYPAVLKPTEGSGSMHVRRVDDQGQLLDAFQHIQADASTDLGRSFHDRLLLEEYITGPEISVEGFISTTGSTTGVEVVSITQKLLGPEPWFVELGHIVEGEFDAATRRQITAYVREVTAALDIRLGTFHCELRLSRGGPVVIEIGARLAGDRICRLIELAKGIALPDVLVRAYTGEPIAALPVVDRCHAGITFLSAPPELAVFRAFDGLDTLRDAVDGVEEIVAHAHPGDPLPPLTDFRARLGHVIVTAPSYLELTRRLAAVKQHIVVRGDRGADGRPEAR